jgi:membrane protease subunit (stomatin/prohibitin family)
MGRSQSAQISKQSEANSQADEVRAGSSYNSTVDSINKYSNNLDNFLKFGRATYGANGEYARDQNTIATGAAAAGANKVGADLATNAMRTGANTANYAPAVATSQREASQDLTQNLAGADADRLAKLTAINQYGVSASGLPASVYGSLYGTGTSGSNAAMGTAASAAAASPGFMDEFGKDLSSGIGAAAGAAGAVL